MTPPVRSRRLTRFLLLWLFYAPVMSLVWLLVRWVGDGEPPNWIDPVVIGTTTALCYAGVESLVPRSPAGEAADQAARRAVTRGALPDDVDPPVMRAALLHVKRVLTMARRWGVPVMAAVTVGVVALTLVDGLDGVGLLVAALCLTAVAVAAWLPTWQLRRVDRLLAELDARPADSGKALDR